MKTAMDVCSERRFGNWTAYLYGWNDQGETWLQFGCSFGFAWRGHVAVTLTLGRWDLWAGLQWERQTNKEESE